MANDFSIATLNVRGLHNFEKRNTIYQWFKDKNINIVCLQETFCTEKNVESFSKNWTGKMYHCVSNSNHSRGVSILFNESFVYKFISKHCSNDGRKLLINIQHGDDLYTIVNLYAPNEIGSRSEFFKKCEKWIMQYRQANSGLIMGGDFNTSFDKIDRKNKKMDSSNKHFTHLCKYTGTIDTWRYLHNEKETYTYFCKRNTDANSRIV